MFFSRKKQKAEEILPPPPPFPEMSLGQGKVDPNKKENHKFFDEEVLPSYSDDDMIDSENFSSLLNQPDNALQNRQSKAKPSSKDGKRKQPKGKQKSKAKKTSKSAVLAEQSNDFPDELEGFEFKGAQYENQSPKPRPTEVTDAIDEINRAVNGIKTPKKKSFFESIFQNPKKEEAPIAAEPQNIQKEFGTVRDAIAEARRQITAGSAQGAKAAYLKAMELYNKLDSTQKSRVYSELKNVYDERKKLEAFQ